MRNKPLLHPVVEALERQEEINRYLLEQINVLRIDMGYEPISFEYVEGVVDGGNKYLSQVSLSSRKATTSEYSEPKETDNPKHQESRTSSSHGQAPEEQEAKTIESSEKNKRYVETLEPVEGGLELGCDDYYLSDEESEYVFEVNGDTADFYLNPNKANVLLRMSQRSSWANVAKIESGAIPELEENQKYEIKIQSPGKARLIDDYWVIETPVSILISVK